MTEAESTRSEPTLGARRCARRTPRWRARLRTRRFRAGSDARHARIARTTQSVEAIKAAISCSVSSCGAPRRVRRGARPRGGLRTDRRARGHRSRSGARPRVAGAQVRTAGLRPGQSRTSATITRSSAGRVETPGTARATSRCAQAGYPGAAARSRRMCGARRLPDPAPLARGDRD